MEVAKPDPEIEALMAAETWYSAEEARKNGFADHVDDPIEAAARQHPGADAGHAEGHHLRCRWSRHDADTCAQGLYRYYVAAGLLKGDVPPGVVRRLLAGEIEAVVVDQLRVLMTNARLSPDGRTLTVRVPMAFTKRGGRKLVITPDGVSSVVSSRPRVGNTIGQGDRPGVPVAEAHGNGRVRHNRGNRRG